MHINLMAFQMQDSTYSSMTEEEEERKKVLPPDMPKPGGKRFVIRCYVDTNHAGEVTRRSRAGSTIVYVALYRYSKRQGSVESYTYTPG